MWAAVAEQVRNNEGLNQMVAIRTERKGWILVVKGSALSDA